MSRQQQILAAVLLMLALSICWAWYSWPRQKTVPVLKYAPGQKIQPPPAAADKKVDAGNARVLNLVRLEQEVRPFQGYRRNLFKPLWGDELEGKARKDAPARGAAPAAVPSPPPPAPQISAAEADRQEMARYRFMGFLTTAGRRTVFLGKGNEVILVRPGDVLAGRYRADQITDQALKVRVLDSGDEIVIPLVERR